MKISGLGVDTKRGVLRKTAKPEPIPEAQEGLAREKQGANSDRKFLVPKRKRRSRKPNIKNTGPEWNYFAKSDWDQYDYQSDFIEPR